MAVGKVYLSYRRDDDPGYAHALRASLEHELEVMMDVADAPKAKGIPWHATLERVMEDADLLLAVIGRKWEDLSAQANDADDVVIDEIHAALEQGKRVIPVLVGNATLPGPDRLPVRVRVLPLLQPFHLRPESFRMDVTALEGEIGEVILALASRKRPAEATLPLSLGHEPPKDGRKPWTFTPLDMPFVFVPEGEYWMGASPVEGAHSFDPLAFEDEGPPHRVRITRPLWLAQNPVTVGQFRRFVDEDGRAPPPSFETPGFDGPNLPVTQVSWEDALAFCEWMNHSLVPGWKVTLPTEAEWEWAARGHDGRRYPWGNAPPDEFGGAIFGGRPLANVGIRPGGAGPFGAHDQAGLVWEWCVDVYQPYPRGDPDRVREDPVVEGDGPRVIRGGSWSLGGESLRATTRRQRPANHRNVNLGFRVVVRP